MDTRSRTISTEDGRDHCSYQGTETRGCWIAGPDNALASAESLVHRTNATNLIWRHQPKGHEEYRSQGAPAMMRIILMG
jgi:hypothetical protein